MNEFKKHRAFSVQFIDFSRHFLNNAKVYFLVAFLLALTARSSGYDDFQRDEFLKREYSLTKPYQGRGTSQDAVFTTRFGVKSRLLCCDCRNCDSRFLIVNRNLDRFYPIREQQPEYG